MRTTGPPADAAGPAPGPFVQRTSTGHARVDVTDVASVLELLDEVDHP